jgi:gentisate 1,2-dioxygenase
MEYSSKDFNKTRASLSAEKPSKLIHKQVCHQNPNNDFNAERKHPVYIVDLPSKTLSMTIGGLEPRQATNKHRHTYETVIYIQQGSGYSLIENTRVDWQAGDAIYIPVWAWHSHHNETDHNCVYIACENTPLLQNLGVAIREESA